MVSQKGEHARDPLPPIRINFLPTGTVGLSTSVDFDRKRAKVRLNPLRSVVCSYSLFMYLSSQHAAQPPCRNTRRAELL